MKVLPNIKESGAVLSPDRRYRYRLWRRWGDGPTMTFIGLNPSTADETANDRTIKKCIGFASRNGCEAIEMLNLFAFRARAPQDMKAAEDPIGPKNDDTLITQAKKSFIIVACWGGDGSFQERDVVVRQLLKNGGIRLRCLGLTKKGLPRHPVMRSYSAKLIDLPE